MDADNIAWIGILHIVAILGHEDSGVGQGHLFAEPVVTHLHAAGEFP